MRVFISYRRSDAAAAAHAVRLFLSGQLGADNVFMDIKIPAGEDWQLVLSKVAAGADALVVVIGDQFVPARSRRTEYSLESDPVRWEIEQFLKQGKPVFPLLVGRSGKMPAAASLPDSLRAFANAQAIYAAHQAFDFGLQVLLDAISKRLGVLSTAPSAEASRPFSSKLGWLSTSIVVIGIALVLGIVSRGISSTSQHAVPMRPDLPSDLALALWRGTQFLMLTGVFGYGPYAVLKLVSIFRAELRLRIVTHMSVLLTINLWLLGSFAATFLLLSTIPNWRLRPLGTNLYADLSASQYVALASSLAVWALLVPLSAMVEGWCARQKMNAVIARIPIAAQVGCLLVGTAMWFSLVQSTPRAIADDQVALIGYFCLCPMGSVLNAFFLGTLSRHFPLVTQTIVYKLSWWCAWALWFTTVLALFSLSVVRVLKP